MALIATAFERPVGPFVVAKISRACELWNEGEKALAHIHLAHAGLPPCGEGEALRLFAADELLQSGVTPRELLMAQGFDPAPLALLKYSPDQPRVPEGHGRESGQWTSGGASGPEAFSGDAADASIVLVSNEKDRNYEERRARVKNRPRRILNTAVAPRSFPRALWGCRLPLPELRRQLAQTPLISWAKTSGNWERL
jgi:hypothetical protein